MKMRRAKEAFFLKFVTHPEFWISRILLLSSLSNHFTLSPLYFPWIFYIRTIRKPSPFSWFYWADIRGDNRRLIAFIILILWLNRVLSYKPRISIVSDHLGSSHMNNIWLPKLRTLLLREQIASIFWESYLFFCILPFRCIGCLN